MITMLSESEQGPLQYDHPILAEFMSPWSIGFPGGCTSAAFAPDGGPAKQPFLKEIGSLQ